jgi:hypothetical protein
MSFNFFKPRKPGNGNAVQKTFEKFTRAKISVKGPIDNSRNSGPKEEVKR